MFSILLIYLQGHDIKSEEDVFKFASQRAEELFKLSEELNTATENLEGQTLLAETKVKLDESKNKYMKIIEEYFEVNTQLNAK